MNAGQLLRLFNNRVDYVRYDGNVAKPCDKAKATHRLVATSWNNDSAVARQERAKRTQAKRILPVGYALSVCAVPLRELRDASTLRLRQPFNRAEMPVYEAAGSLPGKRKVLLWLATYADNAAKLRKQIKELPAAKCDSLYRNLLRANRRARKRWQRQQRRLKRKAA